MIPIGGGVASISIPFLTPPPLNFRCNAKKLAKKYVKITTAQYLADGHLLIIPAVACMFTGG